MLARSARACLSIAACVFLATGCARHIIDGQATVGGAEAQVVTLVDHFNNVHLVVAPTGTFMIDAGEEGDATRLDQRMRRYGIDPAQISAIIVTHGHADHAGGATWFRAKYGTTIVAAAAEKPVLAEGRNSVGLCPTDGTAVRRLEKTKAARYEGFAADTWIEGPTPLKEITGVEGTIVPVPGHTPGSLVVTMGDVVFVGDLVRGDILSPATAAVHFYMCDLGANQQDLRRLLEEQPEAHRFHTGHFGPVDRYAVEELVNHWPVRSRSAAAE